MPQQVVSSSIATLGMIVGRKDGLLTKGLSVATAVAEVVRPQQPCRNMTAIPGLPTGKRIGLIPKELGAVSTLTEGVPQPKRTATIALQA